MEDKTYSNEEINNIGRECKEDILIDVVRQLNERKFCFLCLSKNADLLNFVSENDDEVEVFICEVCSHKIRIFKENVLRLFEDE